MACPGFILAEAKKNIRGEQKKIQVGQNQGHKKNSAEQARGGAERERGRKI